MRGKKRGKRYRSGRRGGRGEGGGRRAEGGGRQLHASQTLHDLMQCSSIAHATRKDGAGAGQLRGGPAPCVMLPASVAAACRCECAAQGQGDPAAGQQPRPPARGEGQGERQGGGGGVEAHCPWATIVCLSVCWCNRGLELELLLVRPVLGWVGRAPHR